MLDIFDSDDGVIRCSLLHYNSVEEVEGLVKVLDEVIKEGVGMNAENPGRRRWRVWLFVASVEISVHTSIQNIYLPASKTLASVMKQLDTKTETICDKIRIRRRRVGTLRVRSALSLRGPHPVHRHFTRAI